MEIVLNENVEPLTPEQPEKNDKDTIISLAPEEIKNRLPNDKEEILKFCEPEEGQSYVKDTLNSDTYHSNYLNYLLTCWRTHYSAIVDPVFLWHMILSELSLTIKKDPETYRKYFTDSDEKKTILIHYGPEEDPEVIDVTKLTNELKELVLVDIDMFLPKFTTETDNTQFAHSAVFCDAVSPFYNYMMFACDIPKITVKGTKEDWDRFSLNLHRLKEIFVTDEQTKWFNKIIKIVTKIHGDFVYNKLNPEFWKDMFRIERCGSGGQREVHGWITDFFLTIDEHGSRMPHNFNSHIAEVEYINITTEKKFKLFSGLFQSNIENEYLIPEYGYVVNQMELKENEIYEKVKKVATKTLAASK